jgi:adenosine kinase
VKRICEHADKHGKLFCTNLSAPFICEFFGDRLMDAMPYVDFLFGNETVRSRTEFVRKRKVSLSFLGSTMLWQTSTKNECKASIQVFLIEIVCLQTEDVREIAKALSELPKKNSNQPRVVVITQGAEPTVLAVRKFP